LTRDDLIVVENDRRLRYVTVFSTIGPSGDLVRKQVERLRSLTGESIIVLPSLTAVVTPIEHSQVTIRTLGSLIGGSRQ
jgi:hypothetical protein